MKKRIISLVLTILLLISLLPSSIIAPAFAAGADATTLAVDEAWGEPGGTVDVYVKVKNNTGIAGAYVTAEYDPKLTLVSARSGDAFSSLDFTAPGTYANPCKFVWDSENTEVNNDGTLLVMTFRISEDATSGERLPVDISYEYGDIYNADLKSLDVAVENNSVLVIDYTPGDVNGDKVVNGKDTMLIRRYMAGGYGVEINEKAADVNDDGRINGKDTMLIRRYIAGGYDDVVLRPVTPKCSHELTAVEGKDATVTKDGNIPYWYCSKCGKYFKDASALNEITLADTVIPKATNYVVYDLNNDYIKTLGVDIEPQTYSSATGLKLEPYNAVEGYTFNGWVDGPGENAKQVTEIPKGTTGCVTVYAKWIEKEYDITYSVYKTPLEAIDAEKYTKYTRSKGMKDLPNPTLYNYIFIGWFNEETGEEMTSIPVGTTGDITLKARWTSKRNLAQPVGEIGDPIVCTDTDNGAIYFAYEIGTIKNVPLTDAIWSVKAVSGLSQKKSETVTKTISKETAEGIVDTVSKATVDSATWTLSEDWNNVTSVNETWATEHGMTVEEANTRAKTNSNTFCATSSYGKNASTKKTGGTTTVEYDSKNEIKETGSQFDIKVNGKYQKNSIVDQVIGSSWEIGGEVDYGNYDKNTTNSHSGTDTTTAKSKVKEKSKSMNSSSSSENTVTASESETISKAVSEIVSNTKGYGKSYSSGGSNSESKQLSQSNSQTVNSSSSLTWFNSEVTTTTTEYSTDGKGEGMYRLVLAGTVHVYAMVCYDIGSQSYTVYTYNILDDKVDEFLDYCADAIAWDENRMKEEERTVLPFEVPFLVYQVVEDRTAQTEGLQFKTDSDTKTAVVEAYTGVDTSIIIPPFISSGGVAYKVTGILPKAFAGKPIESIVLGDYIEEIPNGAFKDCSSLKQISGRFTKIGAEAFSGCTALEAFNVSSTTTEIGEDAFKNVPSLKVSVIDAETAEKAVKAKYTDLAVKDPTDEQKAEIQKHIKELTQSIVDSAINSGASNIVMDISAIADGVKLDVNVPAINSFELQGGGKSYSDLKLTSNAGTTTVSKIKIVDSTRVPLELSSKNVILQTVNVTAPSYAMLLSADSVNLTIRSDNHITSKSGKAIVCSDPNIVSEKIDNVSGTLDVSGDVYVCADKTVIDAIKNNTKVTVENGEVKQLTKDEFSKYIKGSYNITFDPNGGTVSENSRVCYYGTATEALPVPERTGFTFDGWYTAKDGGSKIDANTVSSLNVDCTLYAHWTANGYTVKWNDATGAVIAVERTASPYVNAKTGTLASGDTVYYGDVLSVKYTASAGYTIDKTGVDSITVVGDVTSDDIFASATPNSYTYNIVYKSSNGTNLGTATVTYKYGTTNTISPPAKTGYNSPAAQSVKWDSVKAKTITFTYTPKYVSTSQQAASGQWWYYNNSTGITYSVQAQYQNRTASTVQIRLVWNQTITRSSYYGYAQYFYASCGGQNTGNVTIASSSTWSGSSSSARTVTAYSGWMTVPVSATATSAYIACDWWTNGTSDKGSWGKTISIPAY